MHRKITLSIDEQVYAGLYRTIGKRKISQFIQELVRPHVLGSGLEEGYKAMAADLEREAEAAEWCNGLIGDLSDEAR